MLRQEAESSLYFFARGILGYDWFIPHIHGPLCKVLESDELTRALIELPRGWLKSTLCSISYPMWLSIRNPNVRVLIVQNSSTNACKKLSVIGQQWEKNQLLRAMYPELLPGTYSQWGADAKCLTRSKSFAEATYEAAGTSTKVVSRHYDVIIEDDTVAPDFDELGSESLAPSHDEVTKAIGWHRTNALPLLNNPTKDKILVVGTRWYDQDLIRWVKDNEPEYKILTRACREDEQGRPDAKGKVTYPERFDANVLKSLEIGLGSYMFGCLYLNTPVRSEDMLFKPEWFRYYDTPPRMQDLAVYTTVDVATDPELAKSDDIDYNVVMTAGKDLRTGEIFVLDYFRERCNPGQLAMAIFDHVLRFNPITVGYDNTAYQRSIEYWLREMMRQQNKFFLMEPISRSGKDAKRVAIRQLQPLFQSQTIFLRTHHKELISELTTFPLSRHDDLADALAMQLQLWKTTKSARQVAQQLNPDPFTFANALKELKSRNRGSFSSPVFDPLHFGSTSGLSRTAS